MIGFCGFYCKPRHRFVKSIIFIASSVSGFFIKKEKPCPIWDKTYILRYHPSWRIAPARFTYFIRAALITGAVPVSHY